MHGTAPYRAMPETVDLRRAMSGFAEAAAGSVLAGRPTPGDPGGVQRGRAPLPVDDVRPYLAERAPNIADGLAVGALNVLHVDHTLAS